MSEDNKMVELMSEFLRIYKFVNHSSIVDALRKELYDETGNKAKVYELSDGTRSTRDIQELTGVSRTTVTVYWKQWALSGIVIPAERKGRYKAAFELKEYGLSALDEIEEEKVSG